MHKCYQHNQSNQYNQCNQCNQYDMPYQNTMANNSSSTTDCTCYLAIVNVPWQYFTNSYDPERALRTGTMFPELDKPFLGRGVKA